MVAALSGRFTVPVGWLGLRVGSQPALSLHSSNESGENLQWLCHDDSTINIISVIIISPHGITLIFYCWFLLF